MPKIADFVGGRERRWAAKRAAVYQVISPGISRAQNWGCDWRVAKVGDRHSLGLGCQTEKEGEGRGSVEGGGGQRSRRAGRERKGAEALSS